MNTPDLYDGKQGILLIIKVQTIKIKLRSPKNVVLNVEEQRICACKWSKTFTSAKIKATKIREVADGPGFGNAVLQSW